MLLSRTRRIRDSQWMELKKRRKSASPSIGKGYQSIIISRNAVMKDLSPGRKEDTQAPIPGSRGIEVHLKAWQI